MLHHTKNKQFSQLKSNTAEQDITVSLGMKFTNK